MGSRKKPLAPVGAICQPDARKGLQPSPHTIIDSASDSELQSVFVWLTTRFIQDDMRAAVDDAIKYVLDGARTWRFDLLDPRVDSDERASVGTKLQYHIIDRLGLKKEPPLDTSILGVAVEIKGTVRATWMIPREGQCQVTILVRIDPERRRFRVLLMRTHRAWLNDGGNQDKKRTPMASAIAAHALEVVAWTDLPPEPLHLLTREQKELCFGPGGFRKRAVALFTFLPEVVIPRSSLTTVGAGLKDPMKRAREAKQDLRERGLIVLVGKWVDELEAAARFGHDLTDAAWVAVPVARFDEVGIAVPELRS